MVNDTIRDNQLSNKKKNEISDCDLIFVDCKN